MSDETKTSELLARVDERTIAIQLSIEKLNHDVRMTNDNLSKRIDDVESRLNTKINEVESKIESAYVKTNDFAPVQKLVYGIVTLILIAVVMAIVTSVLKTPPST